MYALKFRSPKENHLADLIHLNDLYNLLHTQYDPMPDCTSILRSIGLPCQKKCSALTNEKVVFLYPDHVIFILP